MSEYIRINWGASSPSNEAASENRCCIIGKDATYTGTDKHVLITSIVDAQDAGINTSSDLYRAISSFYAQEGVGMTECYIIPVTASNFAGDTYADYAAIGACDGTNGEFFTPIMPVDSISAVSVDFGDGSGAVSQTVTTHWTATQEDSVYTGEFNFTTAGPVDGASYCYSGYVPEGAKVYCSFTTGKIQEIFAETADLDAQLVTLAQNVVTPSAYGTDLVTDAKQFVKFLNGMVSTNKFRNGFVALPATVKSGDSAAGDGGTSTWAALRTSDFGTSQNITVIKVNTSTTGGSPDDDPAACAMGVAAGRASPHDPLTLQKMTIGVAAFESLTERKAWENGQIMTVAQYPYDVDNDTLINYGFTFGSGRTARINNVRCKYLVARTLYQQLFSLLKTGTVKYNIAGLNSIEASGGAAINYCVAQGYCDELISIEIAGKSLFSVAYSSLNDSQKALYTAYKNSGKVTMKITYRWDTSVEQIVVSPLVEV